MKTDMAARQLERLQREQEEEEKEHEAMPTEAMEDRTEAVSSSPCVLEATGDESSHN